LHCREKFEKIQNNFLLHCASEESEIVEFDNNSITQFLCVDALVQLLKKKLKVWCEKVSPLILSPQAESF
jgi:hypothetical protein